MYYFYEDSINLFKLAFDNIYLVENKGNEPIVLKGYERYKVFE